MSYELINWDRYWYCIWAVSVLLTFRPKHLIEVTSAPELYPGIVWSKTEKYEKRKNYTDVKGGSLERRLWDDLFEGLLISVCLHHWLYVQEMTLTCSLTLAVSRGKVTRSATQPAAPAEKTLTPAVGATSAVVKPTMINDWGSTKSEEQKCRSIRKKHKAAPVPCSNLTGPKNYKLTVTCPFMADPANVKFQV